MNLIWLEFIFFNI